MEIIDAVEDYNRNFYTGALGYISPNGNMDMNIAIRTLTLKNENGIYPVGGGIVWDSNPKAEWEEAHHKGAIMDKLIQHQNQLQNV
jgi:anthranilate/para-aminobenzoate synthase component I